MLDAQGGDGSPPSGCRLGHQDVSHPYGPESQSHPDPDRTGSEHQRRLAGPDTSSQHPVEGYRERLDERPLGQAHRLRQAVDHPTRHHGVLGQSPTVRADPMGDHVLAQLGQAGPARLAVPAVVERLDADPVSGGHVIDPVAHGGDHAGELVAHDLGQDTAGQRVRIVRARHGPVEVLVQISPA